MIFQKNVKAGTLLYALLMMGIFSLLLQFYLQSQVAIAHGTAARKEESQAYLMAVLTRDEVLGVGEKDDNKEMGTRREFGEVQFTDGRTHYEETKKGLQVKVKLASGKTYQYLFPKVELQSK